MPRNIGEALGWCEQIWFKNGTYSRALSRVVSYFLSDAEVLDASEEEKDRYEEFLNETINVKVVLRLLGIDFMAYGNSFSSIYVPFKRSLYCKPCKAEIPIEHLEYKFTRGKFHWTCPKCEGTHVSEKPIDRRIADPTQIYIKRWSPHEIHIMKHPISGNKIFLWDPSSDIVRKIKDGDPFHLEQFPWEMVKAILDGKMFEFAPKVVYHMCEDTLAGVDTGGWGISQTIPNFSQAYYVQMAKLYNEVLMQEYVVPFRVVTPAAGQGPRDPLISSNIGDSNRKILSMFNTHRQKPGGWHALPFPVEYQALGGEGMTINTYDHIGAAMDELLNAAGVPAELYKGTVAFQSLPSALRLFQNTWTHLGAQFDGWIAWLMDTVSVLFNWDKAKARIPMPTMADDIERRQLLLQLMSGNVISKGAGLTPLGMDADDQLHEIFRERRAAEDAEMRYQLESQQRQMMQQQFAGGGTPAMMAGQPGGQGGGMPTPQITMDDMSMQADQQAQQLLAMPYEARRAEMLKLKKSNETLWASVKAKMQTQRQEMSSQGKQMIQQQMGQPPPM